MNLAIADLDNSIELDREALLTIVGAARRVSTSRIINGNWRNTRTVQKYSKIKGSGFLGLGRAKRYHYRVYEQQRTSYRQATYLTRVTRR